LKNKGVHNLSNRILSFTDERALAHGLSFVPTPPLPTLDQRERDFAEFARSLRIRNMSFAEREYDPTFRVPSKSGAVLGRHAALETFDPLTERYLDSTRTLYLQAMKSTYIPRFINFSFRARQLLRELRRDPTIIIKPADKGLGITVMNREWYNNELQRQLQDTTTYERISQLKLAQIVSETLDTRLASLCTSATTEHIMTDQQSKFVRHITSKSSRLSILYLLPKIHKYPILGRPIVSSHSFVTTPASKYLDAYLQPFVRLIPQIIVDSRTLITQLESTTLPRECLLTSADVSALYPSIPTKDGILAVRQFLTEHKVPAKHRSIILQLLEIVLFNNVFQCNGNLYRQLKGTAMGTPVAVVFANIYMYMRYDRPIIDSLGPHLLFYRRFIDDILLLTDLETASLHSTMRTINRDIDLTISSSPDQVEFLDLRIFKGPRFRTEHILDLSVHQKRFNKYLYIPASSFHPSPAKRSWIHAELQRYVRNCSSLEDFSTIRLAFYKRLRDRGYTQKFLLDLFEKVHYADRPTLLRPKPPKPNNGRPPILFKTKYTPLARVVNIRRILLQRWPLLGPAMQSDSPIMCYENPGNLRSMLCRANDTVEKVAPSVPRSTALLSLSLSREEIV
jgi:hypothetical protein